MPPTVLVNAGPWLPVPPAGYGGTENVVATLVPELRRAGVRVILATIGRSAIEVDARIHAFEEPQFETIHRAYREVVGVAHAHMQVVLAELRGNAEIDLVHDHLEVVGPSIFSATAADAPPVLHTLHWDMRKYPDFYGRFDGRGRVRFAAVSPRQLEVAPEAVRRQTAGVVPLAVPVEDFPFEPEKDDYVVQLARINPDKGQHLAIHAARAAGMPLVLAGPAGGIDVAERLDAELDDPAGALHGRPDVRYYEREVRPLLNADARWIGSTEGAAKMRLLGRARAALFPLQWEEPGATAAIEALACGTPVVGLRRGALPMIVEDGVTGFLYDTPEGLVEGLRRAGEIDPAACRRAVEERFTAARMARDYLELYDEVVTRAGRPALRRPPG